MTISEGRNREVRRLFEALGHAVSRLIRIRYGAMVLPRGLKRGAFLELDERDIRALTQAAGGQAGERPPRDGDAGGQARNRRRGNRGGGPRPDGTQPRGVAGPGKGGGQGQQRRGNDRGRGNGGGGGGGGGGNGGQPDPMKTSFGYIGADSFMRQRQGGPGGGGQRRGGGGGGGGGGGPGGGRRGGNRGGR